MSRTSVDLFAGGGGASIGIAAALGSAPVVAINHDPAAIRMHAANHPGTMHLCESVWDVDPFTPRGSPLDLLWASPDCTHFSRAKGGKPRKKEIRALAWVVVTWARATRPRVICLENVPEFVTWGPLDDTGHPIPERAGETFREFIQALEGLGYVVEWRQLRGCDFGAPTTRKRLFMVCRSDGHPVRWPEPTHGPGRAHPYRTAAECIDWSIPCPSIFERKRPLADATCRRIAHGLVRHLLNDPNPFIAPVGAGAFWANTRNGERKGQRPRTRDLREPVPTITAKGSQGAVVAAWLAKHYTGVVGHDMRRPLGTITAKDHHSVCAAHLARDGGVRGGAVSAFLTKYYGALAGQSQGLDEPLHTIPTRDRFGLVTVTLAGEQYVVVDIGMRMLQPRELATAQGFPPSYILTGTKTQKVARIGNSVVPQVVEALVAAQFPDPPRWVQPSLFQEAA